MKTAHCWEERNRVRCHTGMARGVLQLQEGCVDEAEMLQVAFVRSVARLLPDAVPDDRGLAVARISGFEVRIVLENRPVVEVEATVDPTRRLADGSRTHGPDNSPAGRTSKLGPAKVCSGPTIRGTSPGRAGTVRLRSKRGHGGCGG